MRYLIVAVVFCLHAICAADIITLNGNWTISSSDGKYNIENNTLPSGIYTALEQAKLIPSVLDSYNDVNYREISRLGWTYSLNFTTDLAKIQSRSHVILTFHGIDTVATITLNSHQLGEVENMFVRYRFDVKSLLEEVNLLEVKLSPPVAVAKNRASQNNFTPPECPNPRYNGECHMNFLRKMQASFSWDWGPAVPSMGIWKRVVLELYDSVFIRDVNYAVKVNTVDTWKVVTTVYMETGLKGNVEIDGQLSIELPALNLKNFTDVKSRSTEDDEFVVEIILIVNRADVELWWPNGYGKQSMYHMRVSWESKNENGKSVEEIKYGRAHHVIRMAFRTVELLENNMPNGSNFYFRVNGIKIFMKGSNWIPSSILPERSMNITTVRHLLKAAKFAHMNMLRVWGGGIYEHDQFYEIADTFGILIWQDLMFACAMYPVYPQYLTSVKTEVEQNVRRLQKHVSIAVWAGNNENEAALRQNWYGTAHDFERFADEYRTLYIDTIKVIVERIDPSRKYLSSSPSNGRAVEDDDWISKDPQSSNYGDIHYYNYSADGWDANIYPKPRFSSEYGFQSYPATRSWMETCGENDSMTDLMEHRQHAPQGNVPIDLLVHRHFPAVNKSDPNFLDASIYMSQVSQAMVVKTETEVYRSARGGYQGTMGALYWQLNDVWVAPSWSGIDFYGQFKILHYWARHFFSPVHIMGHITAADDVHINVANDEIISTQQGSHKLEIALFKWNSLRIAHMVKQDVILEPNSAAFIYQIETASLFNDNTGLTRANSFIELRLRDAKNKVISVNHIFPAKIPNCEGIVDPQLNIQILQQHCTLNVSHVAIQSKVQFPAIFVYAQLKVSARIRHVFSKNGYMQTTPMQTLHLEFENDGCEWIITEQDLTFMTTNQFMVRREENSVK